MMKPSRILALIALLVAAGIAGYTYWSLQSGPMQSTSSGKALIGGPFSLVDEDGKKVTDKSYAGKYTLVYFGYTFCPDVCPTELQIISAALDQLGSEADRIQPLFITIDPERDTPAVLKEYTANFNPRITGLSGTPEQIAAVAKAYRVYYRKVREKDAAKDDYLMDHSSITYLMGPDG
ncbi:MAG TPA: SCO family protein, partial [Rhizobiales bacterium]|nr:SCO family protein [Hyphomicrobiales bacterium]